MQKDRERWREKRRRKYMLNWYKKEVTDSEEYVLVDWWEKKTDQRKMKAAQDQK